MDKILDTIIKNRVIVIIRGIEEKYIIDTCLALKNAGIKMIEITFDQSRTEGVDATFNSIKLINNYFGDDICIGAGTVMNTHQVEKAASAGAKYMISPHCNKDIIKRCIELNTLPIPGVLTPTEIVTAYENGAEIVKIFPINLVGGIDYLKSVKAPLSHIPMLAVGGVNSSNVSDYINAGAVGVGIGSSIIDKNLIVNENFDELTELAKKFIGNIGS